MKSVDEVESLTMYEYRMLMKAYALKRIDTERDLFLNAYATQVAKATKQRGKKSVPVYRKFTDLYDHAEKEKIILNPQYKQRRLERLILRANTL